MQGLDRAISASSRTDASATGPSGAPQRAGRFELRGRGGHGEAGRDHVGEAVDPCQRAISA